MEFNKKYIIVLLPIIIVAAFMLERIQNNRVYFATLYTDTSSLNEMNLNPDDFMTVNLLRTDKNEFQTVSADPQLICNFKEPIYLLDVELKFEFDKVSADTVQIFYATLEDQEFTEEKSVEKTMKSGETYNILFQRANVTRLRIDPGTINNTKVAFGGITVNSVGMLSFWKNTNWIMILKYIIIGVMGYLLFCIGVLSSSVRSALSDALDTLIKYRYAIAAVFLLLITISKIHGYSTGMWYNFINDPGQLPTVLFGQPRTVRSDEYSTQTPYALSQVVNDFPLHNEHLGNMNMQLSVSVQNETLAGIIKFENWGYFLTNAENGFSWHWASKLVLITLSSFELFYFLTKKDKLLSVVGTLMVALSPKYQWWYSNYIIESISYVQILIVCFGRYYENINTMNIKKKCLLASLFFIFGMNFVFCLYPAFQLPLAYLFLVFAAYIILVNKDCKPQKIDYIILSVGILFCLVTVITTVVPSLGDFDVYLNTVYPGRRSMNGGTYSIDSLFFFLSNWKLPYSEAVFLGNQCESAQFISFLPYAGFALIFVKDKLDRSQKLLINFLSGYLIISVIWLGIGFTPWLSKVSLLSYTFENRLLSVFSLVDVYFGIVVFKVICDNKKCIKRSQILFICAISAFLALGVMMNDIFLSYFTKIELILTLIVFAGMSFVFVTGRKRALSLSMLIITFVSGFTVNPIDRGLGVIYDTSVSKEIQRLRNADPEALWIGANSQFSGSYLTAHGVNVFNYVQSYPNMEYWSFISDEQKYIYNRMAIVDVVISPQPTNLTLVSTSQVKLYLNPSDLIKLKPSYIFNVGRIAPFVGDNVELREIFYDEHNRIQILKVTYT